MHKNLIKEIRELLIENNRRIVLDIVDMMYAIKNDDNVIKPNSNIEQFKSYIDDTIELVKISDDKIDILSNLWYDLMCFDGSVGDIDELIPYMCEKQNNALVQCFAFRENPIKEIVAIKMEVLSNVIKFYRNNKRAEDNLDLIDTNEDFE